MKKLLLSLSLVLTFASTQSQNLITENFDLITSLTSWVQTNQSGTIGSVPLWFQGNDVVFPSFNGVPTSYIGANFNNTTGTNTISNWLITPVVTLKDGDVISFYSRTTTPNPAPSPANTFPDRLELRISTSGAFTTEPTGGVSGIGDYTEVLLTINPDLTLLGYPGVWTQYTYTIDALPTETDCKLAFRYYVTNGGPQGANSNFIGIDSFSIDRPLSTESFFTSNFAIFPNPADNVLNIANKNNVAINNIKITDINGRIVKELNGFNSQINIADLNTGIYFLKIASDLGVGTTKIIKN